jgi:hypothetical protein
MSEKLLKTTEQIQNECHKFVETVPNVSYQDATNTFIFMKLAELTKNMNENLEKIVSKEPSKFWAESDARKRNKEIIMKQLPTAEEFLESQHEIVPSIEFDIRQVMIEFAKLHVKQALKEASEDAHTKDVPYTNDVEVDKDSILNAYLLENIK